ncbi:MAG: hypothetical protein QM698_11865 [Micropepsaceae bacterium]
MTLKLATNRGNAADAARIKAWLEARFPSDCEAWIVTEASCLEPGRPPRQTTLSLVHPAAGLSFRIAKPMAEVDEADIAELGARAAALAAEGCC